MCARIPFPRRTRSTRGSGRKVRRPCCKSIANRQRCVARRVFPGAAGAGRGRSLSRRGGTGKRAMDYRILGPLEARDRDRSLGLGGEKQRALLAILLLHRNEVVSADRLIDDLWGESPPAS